MQHYKALEFLSLDIALHLYTWQMQSAHYAY